MRDIPIAQGGKAINLAVIDPKVKLHKYTDALRGPLEDITPLEALTIHREDDSLIYATVPENYAETSWQTPTDRRGLVYQSLHMVDTWTVFLTDFTTVIELEGMTNTYLYQKAQNINVLVVSRLEPYVGNNAMNIKRAIHWAIKTRQPAVDAGMLMSEWIASQISKWKERTA